MLDICCYFFYRCDRKHQYGEKSFFRNLFLSDTNFYHSSTVDFILSKYKAHAYFHQLLRTISVWERKNGNNR